MRYGARCRATVACPMDRINCCAMPGQHLQLWHQAMRRRQRYAFAVNASVVRQERIFGDRHVECATE